MFDLLEKIIIKYMPSGKVSSDGWISFECPCCVHMGHPGGDGKSRGGIKFSGGDVGFHCFNCNYRTRWEYGKPSISKNMKNLLTWLNVPDVVIKDLVLKTKAEFFNNDFRRQSRPIKKLDFQERQLPDGSINIVDLLKDSSYHDNEDFLDMIKYINSRGKFLSSLDNYYWTPEKNYKMNRRIIIPFYWEDKIVGYTGRSFDSGNVKYRYMSDLQSDYIFNTEAIKPEHKFIFVVEGPFDALAVNGVAMLGDKCSDAQADWLNKKAQYGGKKIIVIPDQTKDGGKLLEIAKKHEWWVSFPKWEDCKDTADASKKYGHVSTVQSILTRRSNNEFGIDAYKKIILRGK